MLYLGRNRQEAEVSENTSDVQGVVNPEHVTYESESPKTPWSQEKEQRVVVPLRLHPVELPDGYYPSGKGLFLLIIIHFVLYIVIYKTDGNLSIT
jgi:hypothetical protein